MLCLFSNGEYGKIYAKTNDMFEFESTMEMMVQEINISYPLFKSIEKVPNELLLCYMKKLEIHKFLRKTLFSFITVVNMWIIADHENY